MFSLHGVFRFLSVLLLSCFPVTAKALPTEVSGPSVLDSTQQIQLSLAHQQALVVIFMSAVCPCSNSHVREVTSLAKEFPEFRFVAIHSNQEESIEGAKAYFAEAKLPFPVIRDDKTKWADLFKASRTPHAFVVSSKGELLYQGGVSDSMQFESATKPHLREALEDLKKGRPLRNAKTRPMGCVISRGGS